MNCLLGSVSCLFGTALAPPETAASEVSRKCVWETAGRGARMIVGTGVRKGKGNGHKSVKKDGKSVMNLPHKP